MHLLKNLPLLSHIAVQPEVQQSHQEVVLLPAEQLLGMEQHMLVAHIKVLQEELYAKVGFRLQLNA